MARELWIGVDDDGTTLVYDREPYRERVVWNLATTGHASFVPDGTKLFGIPPGHKAKLVLDEASVTKGGE